MTTEAIEPMKQFKLYVQPDKTKSSYTENSDGTLTIEGIASTTNKDLQGDIILPSAIRSMKEQLLTTTKNLHGDHWYGLDGIYGAIKEVLKTDDNLLKIKAIIRKSKAPEIKEMLDIGVNLGLSIGGKITEYTILEEGWEIKDLRLMEISLTGMPANWDTYGTITESTNPDVVEAKCLSGACHVIRKNLKMDDIMSKNNVTQNEESTPEFGKDDAVDLFNELMASKQDEIVREIASETVKQVSKEVPSLVKAEFEKLKDNSSNNTEPPKPANGDDDGKEKQLTDLINNTVKSTVEETMGKLFKDLNDKRDPTFHVDDVKEKNLPSNPEDNKGTEKGYSSIEIAEKMFANQSQEEFLKSLL